MSLFYKNRSVLSKASAAVLRSKNSNQVRSLAIYNYDNILTAGGLSGFQGTINTNTFVQGNTYTLVITNGPIPQQVADAIIRLESPLGDAASPNVSESHLIDNVVGVTLDRRLAQ